MNMREIQGVVLTEARHCGFLGLETNERKRGINRRNRRALEGVERDEEMTDGQALSLKLLEWATAMQWVNVREEFDEDKLREDLHS